MKFNELPNWAQNEVKAKVKKAFVKDVQEAIEAGEDVIPYTNDELEEAVMEYLNGKDDFDIEVDEDGENPVVEW